MKRTFTFFAIIVILTINNANLFSQTIVDSFPFSSYSQYDKFWGITKIGDNLRIATDENGSIYKVTTTGIITDSLVTPFPYNHGLVWDGTGYWIAEHFHTAGARLFKVNTAGVTVDTIQLPSLIGGISGGVGGLALDGDGIWFSIYSPDFTSYPFAYAYKINLNTRLITDTIPLRGRQVFGITVKGDTIFYVNDYFHTTPGPDPERIYALSKTTGDTLFSFPVPDPDGNCSPRGLHWDGEFLWLIADRIGGIDSSFKTLYKYSIARSENLLYTQLINPILNSTDNFINLNFIWGKNLNTVNYHLQISMDSLFNSNFYNDSTLIDTSKYITGLAPDTKYFWRIKTKDSMGNTYSSSTWNFRTLPITQINLNLTAISQGKYNSNFNLLRQKDTVTVYLRSITAPFMVVDSAEGPIDTISFSNVFNFYTIESDNYYICVKNKQCVETWSKAGGEFMVNSGIPVYFDFTTGSAQAYGSNQKLVGSKYCFYSGDIDNDNFITLADLLPIYNGAITFDTEYGLITDITGDLIVDLSDVSICYNNSINFVGTLQP